MGAAWSDAENDAIVADYFVMLAGDLSRQPPVKSDHNAALRQTIARSRGAIEFKHRNISAVLKALGEDWLAGYLPAFNFQASLVDAVARWLAAHPGWLAVLPDPGAQGQLDDPPPLFIGLPPTLGNAPPPDELEQTLAVAAKWDVAGRDARNRVLGEAGEARVVAHERATLTASGRADLAAGVRWVSREDGDGAGYDIASFTPRGARRLIEVKTTNGWERTPFHISRNELAVADARRAEWCLVRLWNFRRAPKAFELHPPLDGHVSLTPTSFEASFR